MNSVDVCVADIAVFVWLRLSSLAQDITFSSNDKTITIYVITLDAFKFMLMVVAFFYRG